MKLSRIGEIGLLEELERRGLIVGVQHDAAELPGGLIATQDVLVEDVHFRFDWISWRELGYRAAAVNLSDLAASGADPVAFLVTLAVPSATDSDNVVELYEGIAATGVPVVGGDTSSADQIVVSVTAIGRSERVPGRDGAKPGDVLIVTGPLGGAGAAFRREQYVRPPIRIADGKKLGRDAHAMLDISDGIAVDAGHVARRSGVRCVIDLGAVPLADGATVYDLGFGEDFELLAAAESPGDYAVIGRVEEGAGVELVQDGIPVSLTGYEHFS